MAGADGELFLGQSQRFSPGTSPSSTLRMTWTGLPLVYERLRRQAPRGHQDLLNCRDHGVKLNLLSDAVAEHVAKWLRDNEAEWWFPDPWKNFLAWAKVGGTTQTA